MTGAAKCRFATIPACGTPDSTVLVWLVELVAELVERLLTTG
jgi:hypothetical protein